MKNSKQSGFYYLANGFRLIQLPGVKRYVAIPLLINILLFSGLFLYTQYLFSAVTHWLSDLPTWLQWFGTIVFWVFFLVGFYFLIIYTFVALVNFIAAPFNSLLAEKIEYHLTGKERKGLSFTQTLQDTPRILTRQFSILGYYLPRAFVLGILFFIPIVQVIAPFIWFLFHAWLMTLQFVDYPTDNLRIPIKKARLALEKKRGLSYSFGIGVLVLSMIPIVNLFVMPAAVAGATRMWLEEFS